MIRAAWLAVLLAVTSNAADPVPSYEPQSRVDGRVRCWGSAQMQMLLELWQKGFQHFHPGIRFENHMYGAVSAMAGLYTGAADLVLSREIWPMEEQAYEQVKGHPPLAVEVATGSFDVPTKSDALGVFVSAGNPLHHITLAQLAATFASPQIVTWRDLGVTGESGKRAVHRYTYLYDNAGLRLFRDIVNRGAPQWNWEAKEFGNLARPGGGRIDAGQQILDALAGDPYGIAISNPHYANSSVKSLAIGRSESGPFVPLTRDSVASRNYPLTRGVFVFFDHADVRLVEFLRYILSREGREDVIREGDYLPLTDALVQHERTKLR